MPKYLPETARLKAQKLIKSYCRAGLNQTELAKLEGVTQSAINQRLHNRDPVVRKTLAEYLSKKFKKKYIQQKFEDGLEAKKVDGHIKTDDLHCRHKYLVTLLECQGHLKSPARGSAIIVGDGGKVVFQDINIEQAAASELLRDINSRLNLQFLEKNG